MSDEIPVEKVVKVEGEVNGTVKAWVFKKLDVMITQTPALALACIMIAVGLGWIHSPVIAKVQEHIEEMQIYHNEIKDFKVILEKKLTNICLNQASNQVEMARCLE